MLFKSFSTNALHPLHTLSRSLAARLHRWLSQHTPQPQPAFEPLEQRLQLSVTAPTPVGSEFQVNTTTLSAQKTPDVSSASDGSFIVTWTGPDANGDGVFAQRYDASGSKVGSEFQVNTTTNHNQNDPKIAMSDDAGFVIVWSDFSDLELSIFGQRFNADGSVLGSEFQINQNTSTSQYDPDVAMRSDGSFVVTWFTYGGLAENIAARSFDASGTPGDEFIVNTHEADNSNQPTITMDSQGNYIIVWQSRQDGVYGQRFDKSDDPIGSEFQISTSTNPDSGPSIGVASDGSFAVTWTRGASSLEDDVVVQRFNSAGTKISGEYLVNTYSTNAQTVPSIIMDSFGNFIIAWESLNQLGSGYEIYAQAFDSNGETIGSEFLVNTYTTSNQLKPRLAMGDDGQVIAVWESFGQDGSQGTISAQRYQFIKHTPTLSAPDTNLYDTPTHSINLWDYISDDYTEPQDMDITILSNSDPSVISNVDITDGLLSFDIDTTQSAAVDLVIQVTDSHGLKSQDTLTITTVEHLEFSANLDLQDYPRLTTTDLYSLYGIPAFAQPFISFSGLKSYTGDDLYTSFGVLGNNLTLALTGELGDGLFTLNASVFSIFPVNPTIDLNVTHQPSPTVTDVIEPTSPVDYAIDFVDMTFSQPINVSTFNWNSVTLTHDAGSNLLTPSDPLEFQFVSGTTYRISGFGYKAGAYTGTYTLTLLDEGVANADGNPLESAAQATWTMNAVDPQVKNLSAFPAPRIIPVLSVAVRMSQPVDLATFTWLDIDLRQDAGAPLATPDITIATSGWDPNVYVISLPASLVSSPGNYSLTVLGADIRTTDGIAFTNDNSTTWTIAAKVLNLSEFSSPRTIPVSTVAVRLSQPANLSTFTWEDLTLTRDGSGNLATDQITITPSGWDANVYVITLPTSLVSPAGNYQITVVGSGIRTAENDVPYGNSSSTSWTLQGKVLNMSQFAAPRTTPVGSVAVRFSDVVNLSTFTWQDITLTRDSGSNLSTDQITITVSGWDSNVYIIQIPISLTTPIGAYAITVDGATIQTPAGIPFSNSSSTTWTMI